MSRKDERSREKPRKETRAQGGDLTRFYWVLGVVGLIGVGAVGYSVLSANSGTMVAEPVPIDGIEDLDRLRELAQGVSYGDPNAPITIVEFGDYQCPSCGVFAQQVKPRIDAAWIESGQARMIFYDYPLVDIHPNAFLAARAARCAGDQGKYWEYHDRLFVMQGTWSPMQDPSGAFLDYAGEVSVDEGVFEECLRSERFADVVTANMHLAEQFRVSGTPTILVRSGSSAPLMLPGFSFEAVQAGIEQLGGIGG